MPVLIDGTLRRFALAAYGKAKAAIQLTPWEWTVRHWMKLPVFISGEPKWFEQRVVGTHKFLRNKVSCADHFVAVI